MHLKIRDPRLLVTELAVHSVAQLALIALYLSALNHGRALSLEHFFLERPDLRPLRLHRRDALFHLSQLLLRLRLLRLEARLHLSLALFELLVLLVEIGDQFKDGGVAD